MRLQSSVGEGGSRRNPRSLRVRSSVLGVVEARLAATIGEPRRDGDAPRQREGAIITDPTRTANGMSADVDVSVQSPGLLCNSVIDVQGRPARTDAM